jgi:hypothetical protein
LKECPRDIADLDWPESKKIKEDQELGDWMSEINSADWTICHVRVAHRIPVVICDHLIQGTTLLDHIIIKMSGILQLQEESHAYFLFRRSSQAAHITWMKQ